MINGYPTGSFLSGDENTHMYRWVMRSTGHIVFSDATVDSHWSIMDHMGLEWSQAVAFGYFMPGAGNVMITHNETKMSNQQLMNYVEEAFTEKVIQETEIKESKLQKDSGIYLDGFGYWHGKLYIADYHHADILKRLIDEGYTWEELINDPPTFGWLEHTDTYSSIPKNPIHVNFGTGTGAPRPTEEKKQEVLNAISKEYGAPAAEGPVDIRAWDIGGGEGVDSYEYNFTIQRSRRQSANGWYKWIWNPESNDYQEWQGDQSHPEIAMMLWRDLANWQDYGDWWGGSRHDNGTTEVYWHPTSFQDRNDAKRNAPPELLQHLLKRRVNR